MTIQARTLGEMVLAATERYDGTAIRSAAGEWSFPALGTAVREVARGLMRLGIEPGDRVAILAETRPEWTLADAALLVAGAVVVPVYHTNSPGECKYVLEHSGAKAIVCEDGAQLDKVEHLALEHFITMEPTGRAQTLDDLRTPGDAVPAPAVEPDDVATIVYTSGTTGPPKGCMLTHRNFLTTAAAYEQQIGLRAPFTLFMFLPLAHALARVVEFVALDGGGTLAFWSRDPKKLVDDVAAAQPTHFPSVPRVFEKIHARVLATAAEGSPVKRRLFDWAVATGRRASAQQRSEGRVSPALQAQRAVAERLVLARIRRLFGGQIELALTGAAPIAVEVLEFLDGCGVTVLEGYGMTETTAAATLNTRDALRFGSVGQALPGTDVEIADDGEILLSGPNVFRGYYHDDEATAETLSDGKVRTGDLGELDADGFLRITGRKKDIIITSSGKNVTPSNLESALRESRWISQAIVHGDNRPYLVALLTLDPDEVSALAEELGVPADPEAMAADDKVREALQRDVDTANARFARIEQIKRFTVLGTDLSQDAGELTPTMKVKRNVVAERYRSEFDALYG